MLFFKCLLLSPLQDIYQCISEVVHCKCSNSFLFRNTFAEISRVHDPFVLLFPDMGAALEFADLFLKERFFL